MTSLTTVGGKMDARRRRLDAAHPDGRGRHRGWATALVPLALLAGACGAFSNEDETSSTIEVDRANREEGDREGAVGDEIEVYRLTASVLEVERVAEYGEMDTRGYVEARVSMHNPSGSSIDYDRTDWKLEKPDGTTSNTSPVSNQPQLQDDTLPAGETIEGTVIFAVGDAEGQFAITFSPASERPDDPLEVERGVWVFESSPEDAG